MRIERIARNLARRVAARLLEWSEPWEFPASIVNRDLNGRKGRVGLRASRIDIRSVPHNGTLWVNGYCLDLTKTTSVGMTTPWSDVRIEIIGGDRPCRELDN